MWQALPHRGDALIAAAWPAVDQPIDAAAMAHFAALQAVVSAVRNTRVEYGVEPGRKIPATIVVSGEALRRDLAAELVLMASVARLDIAASFVHSEAPLEVNTHPGNYVAAVVADGLTVYLPLVGLADPVKEVARLNKQASKLRGELDVLVGRLSSPKFTGKAPADVVAKAEKERADLETQLDAVCGRLKTMEALLGGA